MIEVHADAAMKCSASVNAMAEYASAQIAMISAHVSKSVPDPYASTVTGVLMMTVI